MALRRATALAAVAPRGGGFLRGPCSAALPAEFYGVRVLGDHWASIGEALGFRMCRRRQATVDAEWGGTGTVDGRPSDGEWGVGLRGCWGGCDVRGNRRQVAAA